MQGSLISRFTHFLRDLARKSDGSAQGVPLDAERRLIYIIIWPSLMLIFSIQALLARTPIQSWQIIFVIGALVCLGFSYYLLQWLIPPYAFAVTAGYLLGLPFFFNDTLAKPWVSYGLIIFLATCIAIDIQKWFVSIPLIGLLAFLQQVVVNQRYEAITDTRDIRALHGYFSSTWVILFGVCAFWVLREYRLRANSLEGNIEGHQRDIFNKLRNINKLNRRDYRNIQLHGTVLNTLNAALLDADLMKKPKELSRMLRADIASLLADPVTEQEVRRKYNEISTNYRIQVASKIFPWQISDRRITAQTLELIREVILNTYRHTEADRLAISMRKISPEKVLLEIKDNSLQKMDESEFLGHISAAQSSRTLKRLIQGLDAKISIGVREERSGLLYSIYIPIHQEHIDPAETLYRIRNNPISFFATGLARIAIFYSLACIPGYFALHVDWRISAIIIVSSAISLLSIFMRQYEKWLVYIATYLGILGFSASAILFQGCEVGVYIPWLYNYVIGVVFLSAVTGSGAVARWAPAVIFGVESLVFSGLFYKGCSDLLNGSTPGLVVIVLSAIATLNLRRRYSEELADATTGIYSDTDKLSAIQEAIEVQAQWVVNEISEFAKAIEGRAASTEKLTNEIRRQVDLVRAFLLCSEHFESAFVRELFDFTRDRYIDGQTTRIQIYGENFVHLEEEKSARALFTKIYESVTTKSLEITLQGLDKVSMEIFLDSRSYSAYLKNVPRLPKTPGIVVTVERV